MIGQLKNKIYQYRLFLCDYRKNIIGEIVYSDIKYSPKFDDFNELEFSIPYFENNILRIKDENYDLTKTNRIIKLEIYNDKTLVTQEFYSIDNPNSELNSDGIFTKSIHCYSLPYTTFQMHKLRGYTDQVRTLYDSVNSYSFSDNTSGGILNLLLDNYLHGSWSIGYCNSKYLNIYKTFSFSDSTYIDVIKELENIFGCIILYDSVNNTLNIYSPDELSSCKDLVLSKENFLKSARVDIEYTGMKTKLYFYGKDNISINKYTIDGMSYIFDFTGVLDDMQAMDSALRTKFDTWLALRESKEGEFEGYIDQLNTLTASINTKNNELTVLKQELAVIQANLDGEKKNSHSTTLSYSDYLSQQTAKQAQIDSKNAEIASVNSQITTVNNNITTLNNLVKIENNFTTDELQVIETNFIKEDTVTVSSASDEKSLYEYGVTYIKEKAKLPVTIEFDLISIFDSPQYQDFWDTINCGDYVYIDLPELGYNYDKMRLISYSHSKTSNSLSISLSNTNDLNIDLITLNDIFKKTTQTASTVDVNKDSYASYTNDKDSILNNTSTIDTSTNNILSNGLIISQRGFIGQDLGSNGAIQYLSDKIIISKDNFVTYHTLLSGEGLLLEADNMKSRIVLYSELGSFQIDKNVGTTSSPIWTNTAFIDSDGDMVLEGKVSIGSGNSIFKADINGIYLGNTSFSSAPFRVTPNGTLYASNANITGGAITGGTINIDTNATIGNNLTIGNLSATSASKNIFFYNDESGECYINVLKAGSYYPMLIRAGSIALYADYDINFESPSVKINGDSIPTSDDLDDLEADLKIWVATNFVHQ